MPIANARMYTVNPSSRAAWHALLARVIADSGVAMQIIDHAYPEKLVDLWARPDLGCAFMCGWPFMREGGVKTLLAAPVPAAGWAAGQPVYRSDFIVPADSPITAPEQAFGHRFAFNALDSHSGYNAPRAHFSAFADRAPLFAEIVGPFVTHQRTVEAIADGRADMAAIDSLYLAIMQRHLPALTDRVRVVGGTAPCPIPPLVATGLAPTEIARVRTALLALNGDVPGRSLLAEVCLTGFVAVDRKTYQETVAMERLSVDRSFRVIK